MDDKIIDSMLDELCMVDPEYSSGIEVIEKKFNCSISCDIEKHNSLQFTYYYEIDFNLKDNYFVEIENGINNGTQLINCDWGVDTKEDTIEIEVLKDIVLNTLMFEALYNDIPLTTVQAEAFVKRNKDKLFKYHRENAYDNYVTGGNSKLKLDPTLYKLPLTYIYETKTVDRNFI